MFLTSVILELVRRFRGSYHFTLLLSGLALCLMDPRCWHHVFQASCLLSKRKESERRKMKLYLLRKAKVFPKASREQLQVNIIKTHLFSRYPFSWPWNYVLPSFRRQWHPAPVLLPGESQGQGSLVGCLLWGRTESATTEATQQQLQHNCVFKCQIRKNNCKAE